MSTHYSYDHLDVFVGGQPIEFKSMGHADFKSATEAATAPTCHANWTFEVEGAARLVRALEAVAYRARAAQPRKERYRTVRLSLAIKSAAIGLTHRERVKLRRVSRRLRAMR